MNAPLVVGVCGECAGPVEQPGAGQTAKCACGLTVIPAAGFRANATLKPVHL